MKFPYPPQLWFTRVFCAIALSCLVADVPVVEATWYSENIANGSDLIMMDLRWPWWPSGTYYANWNSSFNPKPNNISFYAGFLGTVPDGPGGLPNPDENLQAAFRPGSVWTFWGNDRFGTPVRFTDVAPNLFIKNDYGGEGSSGTMGAEGWPFVKSQRWYTMLARVWQPLGDTNSGGAFMGRWIKDLTSGEWHLIGIAQLPIPASSFAGNSGFIETLSSEIVVRPLHRRLGYCRRDGVWLKADTIAIDKTQYVIVNTIPEGDHEYAAIEYSNRPDLLPRRLTGQPLAGDRRHTFPVRQPDQPVLDRPMVTNVTAESNGHQLAVSWEIPATAAPAFAYRIEVFDNAECRGVPAAVQSARAPSARHALLDVASPNMTVRLTVTDIFDQTTAPVILTPVVRPAPSPASELANTVPGLAFDLFLQSAKHRTNYFYESLQTPDEEHYWLNLADLPLGKLTRSGLARAFDHGVLGQRSVGYALVYRGYLRVPADGFYLFSAGIDGAYRLQLDGTDALVWDGQHGTTEKVALRQLSRGDHALVMTHLYDELPGANFNLEWEGPGLPRQPISVANLRVLDSGIYPEPALQLTASGDGSGRVTATVDPRGQTVNQTMLFVGSLQLAEAAGPNLEYQGPLPRGSNSFWVRVLFNGNHSVDSLPVSLEVTGPSVASGWTHRNVGDDRASYGFWPAGTNGFQFFGNGLHTVTRKIHGDFTVTCRVDEYSGSHGEPVNPHAWVGLTAREYGDRLNWEWGQDFHLVQTAADGLRSSADFTDFGGTRVSSYEFPKNRPWLRICRQGNIWTTWTSADGQKWELGGYQFKRAREEMDVGLFVSALPQETRAHYHARVSELTIVSGIATNSLPPTPPVALHTAGDRLTGVAISRSDPQVVVVRSTARGLLRTTDGGRIWRPANGNLSGADLAVRSVAIHPRNPRIILRGGGRPGEAGGLWKSADGGENWNRLALPGDFDGVGPSALCGEVLAFDLRDPQIIYAGCESQGFFKSVDGGTSWHRLGLAGERVTSVTVWPWERYYPAVSQGRTHACITTCPDRWLEFLGRGQPGTTTPASVSRSYTSPDGLQSLAVADERSDTGFYNAAFEKAMQTTTEMRYATTHGYQSQVSQGNHMTLYPEAKNLESWRPFTALGATAMGNQKFGRFITQALDPRVPGRLSRSEVWAFEWSWLPIQGTIPTGGLIAASGESHEGRSWWFVYTDGLYHSPDGGEHFTKVLDELGRE